MRKFERLYLTNDLPIFASFHFTPRRTFSKKGVDGIERKSFHKIGCRSERQLLIGRLAGNQDMSIFGAAFDASTDRWIAFNEETLAALSEHDTEVEALEACRRYLEREIRCANILHYLTRHAI